MRGFLSLAFLLIALAAHSELLADPPLLERGVYINDGSDPLEVDRHSAPFAVDWNNDGNKDLLVGQFTSGYIWLYLNQGTDLNPVFNGGSLVQSNGSPITTSYG